GAEVVGFDVDPQANVGRLRERGVEVHLEAEEETLTQGIDLVVKSPGVRADVPLIAAARARGIPVWDELELGARLLSNPIVAVTGTNGKTTTTALIGEMFRADGRRVEVAGNIGRALSSLVGSVEEDAWVVCEVGVFQLDDMQVFHPRIGVLVNLEADHLDRYGRFEDYAATKLRLFALQTEDDTAVVPRGFGDVPGTARAIEFAGDDLLPAEPSIPGAHNRENAAAATAAARAAGVSEDAIARALRSFPGVEHRIEDVATVGGVRYVNDSKATNAAAALRAIEALRPSTLHVILGGRGKNETYAELAAAFREGDRAYLIGEAAEEIATALGRESVQYVAAGDLETAVARAAGAASPGDVVLLSPACASFDQFRDFEARGDAFRELVEAQR
ncbi:MAG TPA: UDP-N-acetylmuramoyl-L-alanine--D-glutamate ligase, partial [Gaiellaceae bacterium]|nr:UDP-N-acetylmuramoyl-L-alanine--D-glutamate ligase [Gaiellaceae bacterium]